MSSVLATMAVMLAKDLMLRKMYDSIKLEGLDSNLNYFSFNGFTESDGINIPIENITRGDIQSPGVVKVGFNMVDRSSIMGYIYYSDVNLLCNHTVYKDFMMKKVSESFIRELLQIEESPSIDYDRLLFFQRLKRHSKDTPCDVSVYSVLTALQLLNDFDKFIIANEVDFSEIDYNSEAKTIIKISNSLDCELESQETIGMNIIESSSNTYPIYTVENGKQVMLGSVSSEQLSAIKSVISCFNDESHEVGGFKIITNDYLKQGGYNLVEPTKNNSIVSSNKSGGMEQSNLEHSNTSVPKPAKYDPFATTNRF